VGWLVIFIGVVCLGGDNSDSERDPEKREPTLAEEWGRLKFFWILLVGKLFLTPLRRAVGRVADVIAWVEDRI